MVSHKRLASVVDRSGQTEMATLASLDGVVN